MREKARNRRNARSSHRQPDQGNAPTGGTRGSGDRLHEARESIRPRKPADAGLQRDRRGNTNGKYNGILTWAPDRISKQCRRLGRIVDLMDAGILQEIRTYGQSFRNNPNEKFLLMILGSQAKLENDNRGINVKRGLRTRVEMGLWPGTAPSAILTKNTWIRSAKLSSIQNERRS